MDRPLTPDDFTPEARAARRRRTKEMQEEIRELEARMPPGKEKVPAYEDSPFYLDPKILKEVITEVSRHVRNLAVEEGGQPKEALPAARLPEMQAMCVDQAQQQPPAGV